MPESKPETWRGPPMYGSALFLVLLVFLGDLRTPLGFAHGTLYLAPVLLAALTQNVRFILAVSLASVALTIKGYVGSPPGFESPFVVVNRLVSMVCIGGIAFLSILFIRKSQRSELLNRQLQESRVRHDEESRQLSEELTDTLESITDALFTLDRSWRFTFVNRAAESLMARKRDELLGNDIFELFPGAKNYREYYEAAMHGNRTASFQGVYAPLGNYLDVRVFPKSEGIAVYFRDITEERLLRERLAQSQRLEAIGQLTGGVAHDFNNLLTVVQGNIDMLTDSLVDQPQLARMLSMTSDAAARASDLTRHLLAFARRQPLEPQAVDVKKLINRMEPLLRRTLMENISIEIVHGGGLWPSLVDAAQLESALLNLCLNARDAMPEGGRLTIETCNAHLDQAYAEQHVEVEPGQYVLIAVSDTGIGIAAGIINQVFDPFFTTKEADKGTGMGLSMVFGFVKQSHGHITIYSEENQGTTVRIYLPRALSEPAVAAQETGTDVHRGNESILMVEDDALVQDYAEQLLASLGYRVITASNAEQALALLDKHPEVELLFTDIIMPGGMNGRQLADEAQRRRPGLKVLFTSGYTENAIVHQGRLDPGVNLISKPYLRKQLADKLRAIFNTPDR